MCCSQWWNWFFLHVLFGFILTASRIFWLRWREILTPVNFISSFDFSAWRKRFWDTATTNVLQILLWLIIKQRLEISCVSYILKVFFLFIDFHVFCLDASKPDMLFKIRRRSVQKWTFWRMRFQSFKRKICMEPLLISLACYFTLTKSHTTVCVCYIVYLYCVFFSDNCKVRAWMLWAWKISNTLSNNSMSRWYLWESER